MWQPALRIAPRASLVAALSAALALGAAASSSGRAIGTPGAARIAGAKLQSPSPLRQRRGSGTRSVGLGQAECSSWIDTDCYYAFINDTPYEMTLTQDRTWYGDNYSHGFLAFPVDRLEPGQKEVFGFEEDEHDWIQAAISYVFTDVDGVRHEADYNIDGNGNPWATSNDFNADDHEFESTATFHMAHDSDGEPNDIDAVLSHPAVVTYDASTQAAQAASIMTLWPQGKDRDFTIVSGPTYSQSTFTRASALVENTTKEPATLTLTGTDSHEEATSIGASLTWTTELGLLGLVNQKVSATLSGGHQWSTTDKTINSESVTVPGGDVGCLFDAASEATVTGDFTFTTPQGITYHVNNVTVTDPAQATNGPPVVYRPGLAPIGQPCALVTVDAKGQSRGGAAASEATARRRKPDGRKVRPKGKNHRRGAALGGVASPGAPLTTGTPIVIDAAKDPQAAASAMAQWDAPTTTNQNFVLTSNPVYADTPTISGDAYYLPKDYPHPEAHALSVEHDYSSQWSVGGTLSAETTLGIIGFANASLQVSVTASHEWTTEHDENQTVTATVDPGTNNWIRMYTGQVTVTGDYSFTANGTDYQVNNVTITEPENAPPSQPQGPYTATVFTVVAQAATGATARRTTPGYVSASGSTGRSGGR